MGRPRVRDKILLAAAELLEQKGVTGLTTRGVAQQAGVTEASIFNNFRDKAGLLQALLKEQMSEFTLFSDALAEPVEPDVLLAARKLALEQGTTVKSMGPRPPPAASARRGRITELCSMLLVTTWSPGRR